MYLVQNDGDAKESENVPSQTRWRFIEEEFPGRESDLSKWQSICSPQLIKTHLSPEFFQNTFAESKTKFLVVLRNPKDALVSYYNFYKMNLVFQFNGTWDDFFNLYKEKKICHGDVIEVQLSWWKVRNDQRVEVLTFEEMLKSPEEAVRRVMEHLGKSLSDDIVEKIVHKTSFKSMKENPLTNYTHSGALRHEISAFMRKGKVGDWKNYFSVEQAAYVDRMTKDLCEPHGLYFEDK